MGTVCCSCNGGEIELQQNDSHSILHQDPNMASFMNKYEQEVASNKLGLSIEIPIAWEYEPVYVETLQGDRLDLRAHIENLMV